jgi:hypothetical protein
MKKAFLAAMALAVVGPSFADPAVCDKALRQAKKDEAQIFPRAAYKVIGKGRLFLHSAPHEDCRLKDVFVIPGDDLIAYSDYKGWYSVMYMNPKTGEDFQGWVDSKRLNYTGDIGPRN